MPQLPLAHFQSRPQSARIDTRRMLTSSLYNSPRRWAKAAPPDASTGPAGFSAVFIAAGYGRSDRADAERAARLGGTFKGSGQEGSHLGPGDRLFGAVQHGLGRASPGDPCGEDGPHLSRAGGVGGHILERSGWLGDR